MLYFAIALSGYFLSLIFSVIAIYFFSKRRVLDIPNSRSNHKSATLTGGGVAIVSSLLIIIAILYYSSRESVFLYILSALLVLSSISFIDDLKNISIKVRIFFQALSIYLLLSGSFGYLDITLFTLLALVLFVFLNFYNFMDGIDGSATLEAIHISSGIFVLGLITSNIPIEVMVISLIIVSACLAFIKFNWHPAKIFLGDVGSTSLGLICGWMLIVIALQGFYAAALILPMYYLADSGVTILRRLLARKKIWQAHSEHFYQQAARNGLPHNKIVRKIIYCNCALFILSLTSLYCPITSTLLSIAIVSYMLYNFRKPVKT